MFKLSKSFIDDIIEAIIPVYEPALAGPKISYMATKCAGCSGTCKNACKGKCTNECRGMCKMSCVGGCKVNCKTSCKGTCKGSAKGKKR